VAVWTSSVILYARVVHLTGGRLGSAVQQSCLLPRPSWARWRLHTGAAPGHADAMPDRHFPAVDNLARRAERIAAGKPDPVRILARTITMTGAIGLDPYAVLGTLIEGAVQIVVQQVPPERQAETADTLMALLSERLQARGIASNDRGGAQQRE
jgi:hypothetical protein